MRSKVTDIYLSAKAFGLIENLYKLMLQDNQQVHLCKAKTKTEEFLKWPSQSLEISQSDMLWCYSIQVVHANKPSIVVEVEQFCKANRVKLCQWCEKFMTGFTKSLLQSSVAQTD